VGELVAEIETDKAAFELTAAVEETVVATLSYPGPRRGRKLVFLSCSCSWPFHRFWRFWRFERIWAKPFTPLCLLALAQERARSESLSLRQPSLTVGLPLTSGELRLASQAQAKADQSLLLQRQ